MHGRRFLDLYKERLHRGLANGAGHAPPRANISTSGLHAASACGVRWPKVSSSDRLSRKSTSTGSLSKRSAPVRQVRPRPDARAVRWKMAPDAIVPAWAHASMQNRSRSSASPMVPRNQPARSACRACMACKSASAEQAAPRGISVESCQKVAGGARSVCSSCMRIEPTGLQKGGTLAVIVPKRLL